MEDKRHELLSDIADNVALILLEHSITPEVAEQVGCAVADHLSVTWAGSTICIPKDHRYRISQRDQEILSKFRGNNIHALAVEYHLTENAIYKLLKRVQERIFHEKQGRLDL
ncbi:MAG: Mor transcription activator-like protein [Aestuariibacter sp.]|nr:Mor transcription activator-like protein [Aestuariibacter sp.]